MRKWGRRIIRGFLIVAWLAIVAGWARSYFTDETFIIQRTDTDPNGDAGDISHWGNFESDHGLLRFGWNYAEDFKEYDGVPKRVSSWAFFHFAGVDDLNPFTFADTSWNQGWSWLSIGHQESHGAHARSDVTYVVAPYWFFIVVLGVLNLRWIVRVAKLRRRFTAGHCRHCGYDLRATPDRCPECGQAAATP